MDRTRDRVSRALAHPLGLAVAALAITAILYGSVLCLPFLFDDIIHLRWLAGRAPGSVWTDIRGMQHYRPLVMWLWAISARLFGETTAWPLHALTLLCHTATAILTGWLAQRITRKPLAGLAATALFAAFPFSYQAIPSPGSLSKPVSALLIAAAAVLYWRGRETRARWRIVAAALLALLAPFSYEAAITAGGYLVLVELALWRTGCVGRPDWKALAAPLLGVPFLLVWRAVPSSYGAVTFPGWEAIWQSSIYFQQALTWPIAILARPLMRLGLSDGIATALVSYIALLALLVWYVRRKRWPVLAITVGWLILTVLVQWVTLSFRYIIDGPRILYGAGVAVAILWADILTPPIDASRLRRTLGPGLAALCIVWGGRFALQRMALVNAVVAPLEQASAVAREHPEEPIAFVNVPSWYGLSRTGFALGHEGYTVLPPYYDIGLDDYIRVNHGVVAQVTMLALRDIRQPWRANIGYHDPDTNRPTSEVVAEASAVYALSYGEGLSWQELGGREDLLPATTPDAQLSEGISLWAEASRTAEGVKLVLHWAAQEPPPGGLSVFVHLYAPDGFLITQADGAPCKGLLPFEALPTGQIAYRDVRYLAPVGRDPDEAWIVGMGLYDGASGKRLGAVDTDGQPLADDMLRIAVP